MDGETYTEDLLPSKGSPQNPMTQQELEDKFMGRATSALPRDQRAAARPARCRATKPPRSPRPSGTWRRSRTCVTWPTS